MLKQSNFTSLRRCGWIALLLFLSAVHILATGVPSVQAARKVDRQKSPDALVDINSATQKELEGIPGVGSVRAKKIIAGRPYKSVEELTRAGFSAKKVEAIKPFMTVGRFPVSSASAEIGSKTAAASGMDKTAKININTADQETLAKLPNIGPVKAKAIIAGRPYITIDDIMKVRGIKGKTFDAIKDYIVVR